MNGGKYHADQWHGDQNNIQQAKDRFAFAFFQLKYAAWYYQQEKCIAKYDLAAKDIIQYISR